MRRLSLTTTAHTVPSSFYHRKERTRSNLEHFVCKMFLPQTTCFCVWCDCHPHAHKLTILAKTFSFLFVEKRVCISGLIDKLKHLTRLRCWVVSKVVPRLRSWNIIHLCWDAWVHFEILSAAARPAKDWRVVPPPWKPDRSATCGDARRTTALSSVISTFMLKTFLHRQIPLWITAELLTWSEGSWTLLLRFFCINHWKVYSCRWVYRHAASNFMKSDINFSKT